MRCFVYVMHEWMMAVPNVGASRVEKPRAYGPNKMISREAVALAASAVARCTLLISVVIRDKALFGPL